MKDFFNNQNLFVLIWKWKIHFIVVGVIAIVLAAVFSSPVFITPLYKSEARIYPVNTKSYSEESESEQMVEIFNSTDIKRQVIDNFDFANRYEVEPDDPYFQTKILKLYDDRISCKKTEYESIELEALDPEPQIACNIVDSIIVFYNRKVQEIRRQKYEEQAASYSNDLIRKTENINSIADKMAALRKEYGLLDYEIQTEQITQGYMTALAEGADEKAVSNIKKIIGNLEEKGGEYFLLQREMEALEIQRDTINRRLDKAQSQVNKKETYTMVVEEPFPADKKSYPTRWLIVFVSLVATEFLALLTILMLESLKKQKS